MGGGWGGWFVNTWQPGFLSNPHPSLGEGNSNSWRGEGAGKNKWRGEGWVQEGSKQEQFERGGRCVKISNISFDKLPHPSLWGAGTPAFFPQKLVRCRSPLHLLGLGDVSRSEVGVVMRQ